MSEPYQIFVLMVNGVNSNSAVYGTHKVINNLGGGIDEDSLLILNETEGEEPEPTYIEDSEKALEALAKWPTYGSIDYTMPKLSMTVSFKGILYRDCVKAIKISCGQREFEKGNLEAKSICARLAQNLHDAFEAERTIMDWGLEYKGFDWQEETERLRNGVFIGEYNLVDIKREKF